MVAHVYQTYCDDHFVILNIEILNHYVGYLKPIEYYMAIKPTFLRKYVI